MADSTIRQAGKRAVNFRRACPPSKVSPKSNYNHLLKLAAALGFETKELMATAREAPKDSPEEVHLLVAFRALTKERQVIAVKLVEALK